MVWGVRRAQKRKRPRQLERRRGRFGNLFGITVELLHTGHLCRAMQHTAATTGETLHEAIIPRCGWNCKNGLGEAMLRGCVAEPEIVLCLWGSDLETGAWKRGKSDVKPGNASGAVSKVSDYKRHVTLFDIWGWTARH